MNRTTVLHTTPDLAVRRFDHPAHEAHHDPDREVAAQWTIAFVQSGTFELEVEGNNHRMVAGSVLIEQPGMAFTCRHGTACPDDVCLAIVFNPGSVSGAEHAWDRAGWTARRSATPRLALVEQRLGDAARNGDPFELERWGLAAIESLRIDSRDARARGPYAPTRSDIQAVVAVCRSIESSPEARLTIAERARQVGMTGTVLTHAFRRYLGQSPHQYVVRWRLATAAGLLDQGHSVSDACYRAGFENLSHFCRTFHRALGLRASTWRAVALDERRRKVQDLLRTSS